MSFIYPNAPFASIYSFESMFGGSVGDTDSRPKLSAAMSLISAAGGGVLQLGVGTYWLRSFDVGVTRLLGKSGVILRGAGRGKTIIRGDGATGHVFVATSISDFGIADLTLHGGRGDGAGTGGHCFRGQSIERFSVRNVECTEAYSYGIGIEDGLTQDGIFENCLISNTGVDGFDSKNKFGTNQRMFIRNMVIRDFDKRNTGQKAGLDLRGQWNVDGLEVEGAFTVASAGLRFRSDIDQADWANSTAYNDDEVARDATDNTFWKVLVSHTSAASGTFAADRAANPTYWTTTVNNGPGGERCVATNVRVKNTSGTIGIGVSVGSNHTQLTNFYASGLAAGVSIIGTLTEPENANGNIVQGVTENCTVGFRVKGDDNQVSGLAETCETSVAVYGNRNRIMGVRSKGATTRGFSVIAGAVDAEFIDCKSISDADAYNDAGTGTVLVNSPTLV